MVIEYPSEELAFNVFNAGGEVNNATKQMIVDAIKKKIPSGKIIYQKHGGDPRNYRVNFEKVKNIIGFTPKYTIDYGISELIGAIDNYLFDNIIEGNEFFGNYKINYLQK